MHFELFNRFSTIACLENKIIVIITKCYINQYDEYVLPWFSEL